MAARFFWETNMKTYKVLETHIGDRPHDPYQPGETRDLTATDAKRLVEQGLLEEAADEPAKAEEPAADKKPAAKKAAN